MVGACGRMGRMIETVVANDPETTLIAAVESSDHPQSGKPYNNDLIVRDALPEQCDVVIDFSVAHSSEQVITECAAKSFPVVVGTTGHSSAFLSQVKERISKEIPVIISPNMSVGVNLIFKFAAEIAAALGQDYDIEVIEKHHRFKKDAPSGTALKIAHEIAARLNRDPEKIFVHGRQGQVGERTGDEIGIHAIRAGDIVGEHTILYSSLGERIELTHKAHTRENFARGSVVAAKFLAKAKPGLYSMRDVINL
jgi:4-hydroxy-tetrahydrodipicolinate reductase